MAWKPPPPSGWPFVRSVSCTPHPLPHHPRPCSNSSSSLPIPIIVYFLTLLSKWSDPFYGATTRPSLSSLSASFPFHALTQHTTHTTQFTTRSRSPSLLSIELGSTTIPIYQYNIHLYLCCHPSTPSSPTHTLTIYWFIHPSIHSTVQHPPTTPPNTVRDNTCTVSFSLSLWLRKCLWLNLNSFRTIILINVSLPSLRTVSLGN